MDSKIVWNGNMAFTGTTSSGFMVPLDAKKDVGGKEMGFRPIELVAIGLIGCTGMDVISILRKKRQEVTDFEVTAQIERAEDHPKVFEKVIIEYKVTGKNIDRDAVERAVELSENKYCAAQAMVAKTAEITHKIIIQEAD